MKQEALSIQQTLLVKRENNTNQDNQAKEIHVNALSSQRKIKARGKRDIGRLEGGCVEKASKKAAGG